MIDWLLFASSLLIILISVKFSNVALLGRLLSLIAVMLGTTMVVLGSLRLVPGDPIDHILGDQAQSSSRELLAKELGLIGEDGKPVSFASQYSTFIKGMVSNDLKSFRTRRNTLDMLLERLPYTVLLAFSSLLVAILIGPLMGIISSFFANRFLDRLLSIIALMGISTPSFFLAPILLLCFSIHWSIFPISGADNGLLSVILPAISMGFALSAMQARISRASMLEILSEDFIRTAYAKGLSTKIIYLKHALRNALIPLITIIGLQFGAVLSGTVVTEKIFNWPGVGLLLLESIQSLDIPMVQTCVIVIAFMFTVINMITDLIYRFIDPRFSLR